MDYTPWSIYPHVPTTTAIPKHIRVLSVVITKFLLGIFRAISQAFQLIRRAHLHGPKASDFCLCKEAQLRSTAAWWLCQMGRKAPEAQMFTTVGNLQSSLEFNKPARQDIKQGVRYTEREFFLRLILARYLNIYYGIFISKPYNS